jgi:hypothetical protein
VPTSANGPFPRPWLRQAPLDLLAGLLPDQDPTLFLLACLAPAPRALEAWSTWRARHGPAEGMGGAQRSLRSLSAVLACSLLEAGASLDRHDATWLRAAQLHEQRRTERYQEIAAAVLASLSAAGLPFLLARGAAVAEGVLPKPWLRHCHDLDLLVPESHLDRASEVLVQSGLREEASADAGRAFLHRRLLPVRLHPKPLPSPFFGPLLEDLQVRARQATILGTSLLLPSADDLLLHVCCHAACRGGRTSLRWVSDAHAIVVQSEEIDWSRLRTTAADHGLSAQLAVTLGYLAHDIGTPIPSTLLEALAADASRADGLERELLIHAARLGEGGHFGTLWQAVGARSRISLARWLLVPDGAYLKRLEASPSPSGSQLLLRHWHSRLTAAPSALARLAFQGSP